MPDCYIQHQQPVPAPLSLSRLLENLRDEGPVYLHQGQGDPGDGGVHELLQVLVEELEDQVELVLRVDDIQQPGGGGGGRRVSR